MKPTFLRVADLTPGTTITSLEGVDLEGEKALVVSVEGSGDKDLVVLYFPNLKVVKQYKVPGAGKSTVVSPPTKVLKNEQVDQLRLDHQRDTLPIREFIPDSYFPADPNVTSPITDILWRPTIRRTPWPRFYNYHGGGKSGKGRPVVPERAGKRQLKQLTTVTIPENLAVLKAKIGELHKAAKKLPENFSAVGELLSTIATIYANTKKFMREANQLNGGTKSKEGVLFFPLKHACKESSFMNQRSKHPQTLNLNGTLYQRQGSTTEPTTTARSKPMQRALRTGTRLSSPTRPSIGPGGYPKRPGPSPKG